MNEADKLFDEYLDRVSQILATHHLQQDRNGSKLISLLIALPQCVQLIREAQSRIVKSRRDISFVLDTSVNLVGVIAEKIPTNDFNQLKEILSAINIQFTSDNYQ